MIHPSLTLAIEYVNANALVPDPRNARKHPRKQLVKLKAAITEFGFAIPIIIDEDNKVIAGHARLEVAKDRGMDQVPCVRLRHLNDAQKRALAIADNKLTDMSHFDLDLLTAELSALCAIDFPIELTGFDTGEIDVLLDSATLAGSSDPADEGSELDPSAQAVTCTGDLWSLGKHRLLCGDALEATTYDRLLGGTLADLVFVDMPFNVPINGHVSGLGRVRHREFAMASGEMSPTQFTQFLATAMTNMVRFSVDGSIHFHCMDWRHMREILAAGSATYGDLKALCVWNKTNGGMGSLYRSKHELVFVYKNGTAPHINNVELGRHGRYRSNVWDYAGANAFRPGRDDDLAAHPTVKPLALVADAIRDCSKRGALVLDPFAGSGTTILAAERTSRKAAAVEIDPIYVDTAVRRWQRVTGKIAILTGDGRSFAEIEAERTQAAQSINGTAGEEAGHE